MTDNAAPQTRQDLVDEGIFLDVSREAKRARWPADRRVVISVEGVASFLLGHDLGRIEVFLRTIEPQLTEELKAASDGQTLMAVFNGQRVAVVCEEGAEDGLGFNILVPAEL